MKSAKTATALYDDLPYDTQSFGLVDYLFDRTEDDDAWIEERILTRGRL